MVARQNFSIREDALSGFTPNNIVSSAGVNVERDGAMPVVGSGGVDRLPQDDATSFANLAVEDVELGSLGVMAKTDDGTDRTQVLRTFIRTRQHYGEPEPYELTTSTFGEHPCQVALEDQAALTVSHDGNRSRSGGMGVKVGRQGLRDIIVIGNSCNRRRPAQFRGLVSERMNPQPVQIRIVPQARNEPVPSGLRGPEAMHMIARDLRPLMASYSITGHRLTSCLFTSGEQVKVHMGWASTRRTAFMPTFTRSPYSCHRPPACPTRSLLCCSYV